MLRLLCHQFPNALCLPFPTVCLSFQGLSKGAVQNAMHRDGLDPLIMDLDPDKSTASQLESKEDEIVESGPPLKEDSTYAKYFKMLKMVCICDVFIAVEVIVNVLI